MKGKKIEIEVNPWLTADFKRGMLTDDLAKKSMPAGGDGKVSNNSVIGTVSLGTPKVYKKPPSKFK